MTHQMRFSFFLSVLEKIFLFVVLLFFLGFRILLLIFRPLKMILEPFFKLVWNRMW